MIDEVKLVSIPASLFLFIQVGVTKRIESVWIEVANYSNYKISL